jgi:hypothetical protein
VAFVLHNTYNIYFLCSFWESLFALILSFLFWQLHCLFYVFSVKSFSIISYRGVSFVDKPEHIEIKPSTAVNHPDNVPLSGINYSSSLAETDYLK